ncbi:dehydrogenase [Reticulibacter mediterranei]|uniref:Dehydrogenase n=1 Tax=Reticulibacter mediterranei TaxID=2778369 RepID=A0A8J3IG88_9CHLR|nr:glucose 1-dehydrogenase [Reticulibacter mediterranei]GHO91895.1 dehydrogenase [Reticulibacter mediterranei]
MRLQGKKALITGATSGIGQAIAEAFAREGAYVAVVGRNEQRGKQVVETIKIVGGSAVFFAAELTAKTDIDRLMKAVDETFGPVDILVNNAGIFPSGLTTQIDEATFDAVIATNLKAPFFLSAILLPQMAKRGSGKVINITSGAAFVGSPPMALYGSSKAALTLLTKAWAAEFGPNGVNVNAISPGPTSTPGTMDGKESLEQVVQTLPARRIAQATEIAGAAVYLASDEASYVHGTTIAVDGGGLAVVV